MPQETALQFMQRNRDRSKRIEQENLDRPKSHGYAIAQSTLNFINAYEMAVGYPKLYRCYHCTRHEGKLVYLDSDLQLNLLISAFTESEARIEIDAHWKDSGYDASQFKGERPSSFYIIEEIEFSNSKAVEI